MSGDPSPEDEYLRLKRRRYLVIGVFIIILVPICVYSFGIGSKVITFDAVFQVISDRFSGIIPRREDGYWPWLLDYLIFEGTIPRTVGAVLVGAILGIAGAVMQSCIRNPLADPYTSGISSAALFGVTIYLVFGISLLPSMGEISMIVNGFVFALIPCAVMIMVSMYKKTTATQLVLIGIAVMYIFSAFTMIMKYGAEPDVLNQIYEWSIGSVSKIGWTGVWYLIASLVVLTVTMMYFASRLDVISSGDNAAHSLGVESNRVRLICMAIVSMCTAIAVSFSGSIGFIGLVIPHLSRLFVGSNLKILIPCSAVLGALLLVGADVISRSLSVGLPTGAVVAVIGAPVFIYFLFKIRKNGWGR